MDYKYSVSIIIPHYNTPDLLEKLLSTIPDNKEIQTIVIDDHSDENIKVRLQEVEDLYANRDILFLENTTSEHNAGVARNIGLKHVEGEWLLFADADDFFIPGFYEIIKKYFNTDYDMVFFPPVSCDLSTGQIERRHQTYLRYLNEYCRKPCLKTEVFLRYEWAAVWSKLFRTSIIKEYNIRFEPIQYANDIVFSVKAGFYAKKIDVSKGTIYCVEHREGSLTTVTDRESFDIRTRAKIRKFHFLKTHLTNEEFRDSDAYQIAIYQLLLIIRRRYGCQCFAKYWKLFQKNRMLILDIRMFNPRHFIHWIQDCIFDAKQ